MTRISGRFARTLAHLTAAAAIVGTSLVAAQATQATAAEPDGPSYQAPKVGQCRNYNATQMAAESNGSPVIACSSAHTGLVLAVPQLPSTLTWSSPIERLAGVMQRACYPALVKKLGRTNRMQHLSAYSFDWFIPNQTQRSHGARWMRCDLILPAGTALQRLPKDTAPVLPATLTNAVARCLTGTNHYRTTCNKAHNYRATGVVLVSQSSYPGDNGMRTIAVRKCPSQVSTRGYYYTTSGKLGWAAGDHSIVCYSKRSN
jgi:hypothetical protein